MLSEYKREDKFQLKEATYSDLLNNIVESRDKLNASHHNLNYVEDEGLVDYYIYRIRSEQARLNYLIKQAKEQRAKQLKEKES